jgi:hypothetical protein
MMKYRQDDCPWQGIVLLPDVFSACRLAMEFGHISLDKFIFLWIFLEKRPPDG